MQHKNFWIDGMHCAACAAAVERAVRAVPGVSAAEVNLIQKRMSVSADDALKVDAVINAVNLAGYGARLDDGKTQASGGEEAKVMRAKLFICALLTVIIIAVAMLPMVGVHLLGMQAGADIQLGLTLIVIALQLQYFTRGFKALIKLNPNMDSLIAIGAGAAFVYSLVNFLRLAALDEQAVMSMHDLHLYFESTATILTLVSIGKYFEERAKGRTADAVGKLMKLAPKQVRVRKDGKEQIIAAEAVKVGDLMLLKAGDIAGVDGVVVSGSGECDEQALTGESKPVYKEEGSKICTSAALIDGYLEVKATAVGQDTTLARIINLINEANLHKPPIARLADKAAAYFVPAVIGIALITFIAWLAAGADVASALVFAVSVLVVSCPCALGLATPTAIMVGTGRAARNGILFKSGSAIESLQRIDTMAFDKTGTLTTGKMKVQDVKLFADADEAQVSLIAASLEQKSNHPAAAAIAALAQGPLLEIRDYSYVPGRGLMGTIESTQWILGNLNLLHDKGVVLTHAQQQILEASESAGFIVLCLCHDIKLYAMFIIGDEIRAEAKDALAGLKAAQIDTLMLSGDSEKVAAHTAEILGIDSFKARLLPQEKASRIEQMQAAGHHLAMVGDGINDAPAMTVAEVGIGLSGSSDIALNSCDVVLMRGNLQDVPAAVALSKATIRNIKENLFWAFIYNIICIPVAAGVFFPLIGWQLNPMLAALLMSLSSVCVVSNALRLYKVPIAGLQRAESAALEGSYKLEIDGMHCAHCAAGATKALQQVAGVVSVKVDLKSKCAYLQLKAPAAAPALSEAIRDAGFKPGKLSRQ